MNIIDFIVVHHSGTIGSDPFVSSKHLTADDINRAHKDRWDFKSSLGFYGGYHFVIDAKGKVTQHRAVGEEGAHTKGYNSNSIGICLNGNFSLKNGVPVDTPTPEQISSLRTLLLTFIEDIPGMYQANKIIFVPNTTLSFTPIDIYPHRQFNATECYGTLLSDDWINSIIKDHVSYFNLVLQKIDRLIALLRKYIKNRPLGADKIGHCGAERG